MDKYSPRTVLPWVGLGLGLFVVLPWLKRLRPTPTPPGAEDTPCTGPFTLSALQARSIADAIHAAVYGTTEDENAVFRGLLQARTDGDVCSVIASYGSRRLQFGLGPYNLPEIVSMYLDEPAEGFTGPTYIERINEEYARKGIRYRW